MSKDGDVTMQQCWEIIITSVLLSAANIVPYAHFGHNVFRDGLNAKEIAAGLVLLPMVAFYFLIPSVFIIMAAGEKGIIQRCIDEFHGVKNQASRFPLASLKLFRWFVPRAARAEINLAIADLKEDIRELKRQRISAALIFTIESWHVIRIFAAYILDGIYSIMLRLVPLAALFLKRK